MAVAGLILGVAAVVNTFNPIIGSLSAVPGGVGLVLSSVALAKARRTGDRKSMALAALVLSALGTVGSVVLSLLALLL